LQKNKHFWDTDTTEDNDTAVKTDIFEIQAQLKTNKTVDPGTSVYTDDTVLHTPIVDIDGSEIQTLLQIQTLL
jgi:hypothetical protein